MRIATVGAGLALACLLTLSAHAQTQTGPTSSSGQVTPGQEGMPSTRQTPGGGASASPIGLNPLAGPVDPESYRVGPGDLLRLELWGRVSRTVLIEVGPEGIVTLPDAGTIKVDGRTLAEVRTSALRLMGQQLRGVSMDLRLARPRTFLVYLTGLVSSPGPVVASGASRVGDVVNRAAVPPEASMRWLEVVHRDGSRETADLGLFLRTGDGSLNPWLRDGDIVNVPAATGFVWASGAVAAPGRFELGPNDSLLTLFKLAGGPLPAADDERALLVRWNAESLPESLWFELHDATSGKVAPKLREGDRLYVYFVPKYHALDQVTVVGEVARPGTYPIVEGRHRLSYLVSAAGGFLPTADLSSIRVHRLAVGAGEKDPELERLLRLSRAELTASEYEALRTKLAGLREDYRVDWNRLSQSKDLDLLLRDGDLVRVERLVPSIRVDGEVKRPGIVAYLPGRRVVDYVEAAGGFTDRAWRTRVRITRSVTGQTLLAHNLGTLHPGDLVWVPEKPDRTAWEQSRDILTAIAQVATVVIAIRTLR